MKAVILCAGMGTRMEPFTNTTHKALLKIQGIPLMERILQYLHSHNITDITIVTGNKAEQFEYLKDKYSIQTRISTLYKTHNNYTSMQLVLDKLEDCLVLEGDFYICDDFIPQIDKTKNQYFSQKITYGVEWELITDSHNRILEVKTNQTSGWGLIGISYWKGDLTNILRTELEKCTSNEYWDDAVWRILDQHSIYANKMSTPIIQEYDKIEDILHFGLMSRDEIISQCSDDGNFHKIDDNTYIINNKTYLFSNNTLKIQ